MHIQAPAVSFNSVFSLFISVNVVAVVVVVRAYPSRCLLSSCVLSQATSSGFISITVEPSPGTDTPVADSEAILLFKVIDSGVGFGGLNPQRLLHQFYGVADGECSCRDLHCLPALVFSACSVPEFAGASGTPQSPANWRQRNKHSSKRKEDADALIQRSLSPPHSDAEPVASHAVVASPPFRHTVQDPPSEGKADKASSKVYPVLSMDVRSSSTAASATATPTALLLRPSVSVAKYKPSRSSGAQSSHSSEDDELVQPGMGIGLPMAHQVCLQFGEWFSWILFEKLC